MSRNIVFHSFRRGVGRSTLIANLVYLMASEGKHIGVVDTNIRSPGLHILFGLDDREIKYTINDFLLGRCDIMQTVYPAPLFTDQKIAGKVFCIPAGNRPVKTWDVKILDYGLEQMNKSLKLDLLMIETQSGLDKEMLNSMAVSDVLVLLMRLDRQDYLGTRILMDIAGKLDVARVMLVINETPEIFDFADVKTETEKVLECKVGAVLPHSDEMMALASQGIFVQHYPDSALAELYRQIANKLIT